MAKTPSKKRSRFDVADPEPAGSDDDAALTAVIFFGARDEDVGSGRRVRAFPFTVLGLFIK